jgi:hypothetical protein
MTAYEEAFWDTLHTVIAFPNAVIASAAKQSLTINASEIGIASVVPPSQ